MNQTFEPKTYLSLFSGLESATIALKKLNYKALGFAEIAPFATRLLAEKYPDIKNFGSITSDDFYKEVKDLHPEILIGGSPCQAFSLAGLRESLSDFKGRGNLTLQFIKIADLVKAPIIMWENVTGVLNTKDNAFGNFLTGLAEDIKDDTEILQPKGKTWARAGYIEGDKRLIAWRTLNSRFFNTAQNRERVFLIAVSKEYVDAHPEAHPLLSLFEIMSEKPHFKKDKNENEEGIFCTSQDITPRALYSKYAYTLRAGNHGVNTIMNEETGKLHSLSAEEMELLMGVPEGYTAIKDAKHAQRAFVLGNSFVSHIIQYMAESLTKPKTEILAMWDVIHQTINPDNVENAVFEYNKPVSFEYNNQTIWLNGEERNSTYDEVLITNVIPNGPKGKELSMRNTMGIMDRINRKILHKGNIKPKALLAIKRINENVYKHLLNERLPNFATLLNIEVGFLLRWADEKGLTDIAVKIEKYYTQPIGETGTSNLGKDGAEMAGRKVTLKDDLVKLILDNRDC